MNFFQTHRLIRAVSAAALLMMAGIMSSCSSGSASGGSASPVTGTTVPSISFARLDSLQDISPAYVYKDRVPETITLTLTGTGFTPASVISFNGTQRTTAYVSETVLTATISAADLPQAGAYTVSVSTPTRSSNVAMSRIFRVCDVDFGSSAIDTPDWSVASHGKLKTTAEILANTGLIFNEESVQRLDIIISPKNWTAMQNDLQALRGSLRQHPSGMPDFSSVSDPVYVPGTVMYQGKSWYQVGIRYKGNSSLYMAGSGKLPFKLKFNQFEDTYPAIKGQRFYGFKTFSLKNNYRDESGIHEVFASRLFRNFGLKSAHSAFYKVFVDSGSGPVYFGLYALVEEVDDTVLKTQFGDDSGNLYKPEGIAATFKSGSFNAFEFGKKNNEAAADFTDLQELLDTVNSPLRTTDSAAWKTRLEAIFDVPVFLKWLAANTVMQNWDSYGQSPQNYYLYRSPATRRFEWVPWDLNEVFNTDRNLLSLSMSASEVNADWPLIRYLLDDATYMSQYRGYVQEFATTVFNSGCIYPKLESLRWLIATPLAEESSGYTFTSAEKFSAAIDRLRVHVTTRNSAATSL